MTSEVSSSGADGDALTRSNLTARVPSSVGAILGLQSPDGAFIASPDFVQYHYCWLRDGSFYRLRVGSRGRA